MDHYDRQLIRLTEKGLPLVSEPYQWLAGEVGLSHEAVKTRLQNMLEQGVIRRIAAVPNHYRIGYRFNGMSVWDIDDAVIDACGESVGQLDFVSHCYHRPRHVPLWPYNLFAMVHGKSREEVFEKVNRIAELLGDDCTGHEVLFSSEILKKTGFRSASSAERPVADMNDR